MEQIWNEALNRPKTSNNSTSENKINRLTMTDVISKKCEETLLENLRNAVSINQPPSKSRLSSILLSLLIDAVAGNDGNKDAVVETKDAETQTVFDVAKRQCQETQTLDIGPQLVEIEQKTEETMPAPIFSFDPYCSRARTKNTRQRSRWRSPRSRSPRNRSSCSRSRSPSIPRRRHSPSFLDRRRITSARKLPVPYTSSTPAKYSHRQKHRSSRYLQMSSDSD